MKRKIYNLVELFSGIGSQAKALSNIGVKTRIVHTCEWDIHAFVAYDAIHNSNKNLPEVDGMTKEELLDKLRPLNLSNNGKNAMEFKTLKTYSHETLKRIYSAIIRCNNTIDVSSMNGADINEPVDILTYSFPCQDLSAVGAFHGYNKGIDKDSGSRSSLLWQVGRILQEMKDSGKKLPRFLILENVPALISNRHIKNFEIWQKDLEILGYHNKVYLLEASNYGIPQHRPRLIMISTFLPEIPMVAKIAKKELDEYYANHDIADEKYYSTLSFKRVSIKDLVRTDYSNPILLKEALESQPNDTISRREIWVDNPKIIDETGVFPQDTIRTLTTKQDRHPNSGNIYFDYPDNTKSKFRYLTPRECFLFMGFAETDYENVIENNPQIIKSHKLFTRDKLNRMAGNSIPVNLLERVFEQIVDLDETVVSKW